MPSIDNRAALVEKALAAYCLRYDTTGKMRPAMEAAIDLIRAEVLEEALTALYSVPRWDREIFDSLTQTSDGSLVYIDEADAAIRALKEKANG